MALPTFNRQYQSVKGPGQVVQPNMAKIFADMSANMNKQYLARLKAKQDAEDAKNKKLRDDLDYGLNFYTKHKNQIHQNLKTLGVNNPLIYQTADSYLSEITDYQVAAKKSNTREDQKIILNNQAKKQSELDEFIQYVELGKAADKDFAEEYGEKFNNVGNQGGIALTGDETGLMNRYVNIMQARAGIGENITEKWYYAEGKDGGPGTWMVNYNSDRIRETYNDEGVHATAFEIFNFTPETSPETDNDIRNALKDKKIFKSNGSVTDNYLLLDQIGENTLESGLIQEQTPINKTQLFQDIAANVTPIAQGNLKSGNLANIDWTQEIRPWLITQIQQGKIDPNAKLAGTDKTYGELAEYNLQIGDSNVGGSKWTLESQGIYESLFRDYAYDLVGPKQDFVAGKTRRPTKDEQSSSTQSKPIAYIEELKIPISEGPARESGQRPIDIVELENLLNKEGYNVKKAEDVGDTSKIVITKSIDGTDNEVTITENMTPQEIKRLLYQVETGKMPAKKKDKFDDYEIPGISI